MRLHIDEQISSTSNAKNCILFATTQKQVSLNYPKHCNLLHLTVQGAYLVGFPFMKMIRIRDVIAVR